MRRRRVYATQQAVKQPEEREERSSRARMEPALGVRPPVVEISLVPVPDMLLVLANFVGRLLEKVAGLVFVGPGVRLLLERSSPWCGGPPLLPPRFG
jgi:hypothetical protein